MYKGCAKRSETGREIKLLDFYIPLLYSFPFPLFHIIVFIQVENPHKVHQIHQISSEIISFEFPFSINDFISVGIVLSKASATN